MKRKLKNFFTAVYSLFENPKSKDSTQRESNVSRFLFLTSSALLFWLFMLFATSAATFMLGRSLSAAQFVISTIATVPFAFLSSWGQFKINRPAVAVATLALASWVVVGSLFVSKQFYDLDYDSQWYHLEAVIALNEGWNPYTHELTVESDPDISSQQILNSFPKAQEIVETTIYKATGQIETAKSFNIVTTVIAFGFVLSTLLRFKKLNPLLAVLGAILLVLNPITLIQYLSAYVDGSMYNMILSLVALFLTFYITQKNFVVLPIIFAIGIAWNIKLTAVMYSTALFATFEVLSFYTERIKLFFKSIKLYAIAGIIAFLLLGFHPYVTNTFRYKNPFYSDGKSTDSYIYINSPSSLYYMPSYRRFILSIFSTPAVLRGENKTHQLKKPFTYTQEELPRLVNDNTVSGFGSLFSGVFIIALVGTALMLISRQDNLAKRATLFLILSLFVTTIFFPVSSYARFITPFWIFPCAVAIYLLSEKKLISGFVGLSLVAAIFANNYLITREYINFNVSGTKYMRTEMAKIKDLSQEKEVGVYFDLFRSNRTRFEEAGVNFKELSLENCNADKRRVLVDYIPESKITLCYQF